MKTALLDFDIFLYKTAYSFEDILDAKAGLNFFIEEVMLGTHADDYIGFISGEENYRKTMYSSYKANRTKEAPSLLEPLKEYATNELGIYTVQNAEADDALSILGRKLDCIICSIDKDLKQIPGWHWNLDKKTLTFVTPEKAEYYFWIQMLMGDSTDNITGIPGVGIKSAEKLLNEHSVEKYPEIVFNAYTHYYGVQQGASEFIATYLQVKLLEDEKQLIIGKTNKDQKLPLSSPSLE